MFRKSLISLVVVLGLIGSASATLNYEYYEAPEGTQYNALADVNFGTAEPNMIGTSDTLDSDNGNWIEQARTVLQNPRLQLDGIGDSKAVKRHTG